MRDVFISYKREQRDHVQLIASEFRRLGLDTWFDAGLSAGETFSEEIERELRSSKAVLVCWSPSAALSRWVRAEADVGFSRDVLCAVYVDGPEKFQAPVPFNSVHTVDLREWFRFPDKRNEFWLAVLRRLGRLTGRSDIADWADLKPDDSVQHVQTWLARYGASSPLIEDARFFLEAREQAEALRSEQERERERRLEAERLARERAAKQVEMRSKVAEDSRSGADAHVVVERPSSRITVGIFAVLTLLVIGWVLAQTIGDRRTVATKTSADSFNSSDLQRQNEQMQQSMQQDAGVSYDPAVLQGLLPAGLPGGFTRSSVSSSSGGAAGMNVSQAEAEYTRGADTIQVSIVHMMGANAAATRAALGVQSLREDADGYTSTNSVDGRTVTEELSRSSQTVKYMVITRTGVAITADGRGAVSGDDVRNAVNAVNPARVEALPSAAPAQQGVQAPLPPAPSKP
jgi:hypothetical protein